LFKPHHGVVEIKQTLFRQIPIECRADIVRIQRHPLAAAVVVHNDLDEVRITRELMQVLFRAVYGIEGIVVPDMPTYRHRRLRGLYRFVYCSVSLAKAVGPEHFPCGEFGIPQQQPPELNVVAVHGALATPRRAYKLFQLKKSLPGALWVNAAGFGFALTKFAEASYFTRIDRRCVMR